MVKARKYVVKNIFKGLPKREDFEIVEYETEVLQPGQILVKTEWVAIDPYQRCFNDHQTLPYDQFGYQIGLVEESKDSRFPIGSRVISHQGWCDYSVIDIDSITDPTYKVKKLPELKNLSPSHGIGAVGLPGATAYFGFLEICKPKAGETVVITGAAGGVGSLVGQIAKIKGCKVIGFAGSDAKVKWLEEIGFDRAFNYKTVDITAALKEAAPEGVDIYYDNIGGEISSLIIYQMRDYGRVAVCGSISAYNEDPTNIPKASILQPPILFHRLSIQGFFVWQWLERWPEAFAEITKWIESGELKPREHITEGFEHIFDALVGMLKGENVGKAIVKI